MAPETPSVVRATQAWLQSARHVQVPFAWLEACVEWIQGEAGGADHLSQQQINQQVLDQWLLTDLRDLDHPVLPEGLAQAQKTELNGTFCVQVDSLLDVSQPAYGQLQKWRGTDCTNDEVSAVTQTTQRPWEAKATRILLLQITDGVQSLEAMEYQSIPLLSSTLRPGAKLQLQGKMVCRLGVVLLGPSNVKILGGEVEDLVERNTQGQVLCRTLGLPETEQHQDEEALIQPRQDNQAAEDLEVDDAELLASLEEHSEAEVIQVQPSRDSGYGTVQETLALSSVLGDHVSFRTQTSTPFHGTNSTQTNRSGSVRRNENDEDLVELFHSDVMNQNSQEDNMADDEFPDEDFPLDELDSVILQESGNVDNDHRSTHQNNRILENQSSVERATKAQPVRFEAQTSHGSGTFEGSVPFRSLKRDHQGFSREASTTSKAFFSPSVLEPSKELGLGVNDDNFMDEDMDCLFQEVEPNTVQRERSGGLAQISAKEQFGRDRESNTSSSLSWMSPKTVTGTSQEKIHSLNAAEGDPSFPALTLTSVPFTYLCLLDKLMSKPCSQPTEICVKAFIVTLLGKLISSNGVWSVSASISDGTGYLDVELSNEVLTGLLGFSVAEKTALKRDPLRRGELDSGMRRCQEELVDMCCIMTIVVKPGNGRAVVAKAQPVSERVLRELEQRVRESKRS
ncbi:recQ-mediated genome instability protein 1 [Xiphophorus hellerii]|uniref:recQ-mediated genome instability protein 1 n=1 Tax=Xiphophorus hellerii TaxID=8084 RepID=UPI0013B366AA|nr:recQ-mediated genome instability protein 1 [Xiphophorus hellerii]XP_032435338.1 recQ-mediated genome instability protein 1 [Xiphophorus hellerii]XP_032435339.1 recQ-mediated genome instability protein 1 [Xiphophorus hellerii]XP_032435340.1 recQ-mediated genome instability protein 1 [Xiphophorus hellerii]XP_032435341.1 recQ-mediated genome instability protein 1 [Xiphophorus hellerii]XP_032435342.1 recQ-mediated genome instability protein 1 [Xiphophorus hellerii]XP_032435343.1 recQ-mediated 